MPGAKNAAEFKPGKPPKRVLLVMFSEHDDDGVELSIEVSDLHGVDSYSFSFDGVPVPMSGGRGIFFASPTVEKLLEWVMLGNPGGYMKVVVKRGETVLRQRDTSTIAPPYGEGYDAFKLKGA
ncbi:hypothetical protein [Phenylobacterium sp.]|uniref:hypothetical protein n=1 Tax=Phenylobacterium sp. TaxID=1871053 RepID=UPI003D29EC2E